jgi:4-diphosphocytidyl-2-C-methyl-D-erythritol kinase
MNRTNESRTTWLSPGKINLFLRVGEVQPNGFHPLRSWMVTIGLFDNLGFEVAASPADFGDSQPRSTLSCSDPSIPTDASNLVIRAANAALAQVGQAPGGDTTSRRDLRGAAIHCRLSKRIPAGGGLGGGSGNAATTLVAIDHLLNLRLSPHQRNTLAASIGSDVTFFLHAPSAVASGRGEDVRPTRPPRPMWALLILPGFALGTASVYRRLDAIRPDAPSDTLDPLAIEELLTLDARTLLSRLINDLEPPAFSLEPRLAELRDLAGRRIGRTVRMSGSGSTLFSLFDDPAEAETAARQLADLGVAALTVESARATISPVVA